jgi:hypothetical protein
MGTIETKDTWNDLYEDTSHIIGKQYLSVRTDSFTLYKAFKEECEKLGWIYNERFTEFTEERSQRNDCMYFSFEFDDMEGQPAFALSNTRLKTFQLPQQWYQALDAAKNLMQANRHLYTVELNDEWKAIVDTKKKLVRVGCEQFKFDKVLELANVIKKNQVIC